jgi:hypothetical protein
MPKLMVLEETTKYDNAKHYTRKEGTKEGRQGGSEGGREGGREALQQFGGVQMALRTQLWTHSSECWERTRESKQTELLANESEDEAEGKGEEEQDKEKQVKLGFCFGRLYLSTAVPISQTLYLTWASRCYALPVTMK